MNSKQTSKASVIDSLEESAIAIILGLMTVITFANVIARYVFNSNLLWALESTVFLFAWLVLIGMSYCVKVSAHLGVDIILNMVSVRTRKILALLSVTLCLAFCLLLLKGAWDYWSPFVGKRAFLETQDIPMPDVLQFLSGMLNDGERYEYIPRFIPYFALPLGISLLTLRYLQQAYKIIKGTSDRLISSHEVEDAIDNLAPTISAAPSTTPSNKQEG